MSRTCTSFSAVLNAKTTPNTLLVAGAVILYGAFDSAELSYVEPQGINPHDLLLELKITETEGPMKGVCTMVSYEAEADLGFYTSVSILSEGKVISSIQVEVFG